MAKKVKKSKVKSSKKVSKEVAKKPKQPRAEKPPPRQVSKIEVRQMSTPGLVAIASAHEIRKDSPVFSIELDNISGETTIGDLIVVFPRTRDVLMKHGLRFDVEEAGYIYMTLNVFSALHGLGPNSLIQELIAASKVVPIQPAPQPFPQVATPPSA